MKCRECGRGITYRRVNRDAAVTVLRTVTVKGKPRDFEFTYCGRCFHDGKHQGLDDDIYFLMLGDSASTARWIRLEMST